jgi:hypothetical protein
MSALFGLHGGVGGFLLGNLVGDSGIERGLCGGERGNIGGDKANGRKVAIQDRDKIGQPRLQFGVGTVSTPPSRNGYSHSRNGYLRSPDGKADKSIQ